MSYVSELQTAVDAIENDGDKINNIADDNSGLAAAAAALAAAWLLLPAAGKSHIIFQFLNLVPTSESAGAVVIDLP